jgi:hypothetical protein
MDALPYSERGFFGGYRIYAQRQNSERASGAARKAWGRRPVLSEDQPGGGNDAGDNPQGNLSDETRRSVWYFLGVGAAGSAILVDVAAIATAFSGSQEFLNDAAPVAFMAIVLAVIGYFLGARMLAVGAVAFTVVAIAVAAVIMQWL